MGKGSDGKENCRIATDYETRSQFAGDGAALQQGLGKTFVPSYEAATQKVYKILPKVQTFCEQL